jgi:hypothetical protein
MEKIQMQKGQCPRRLRRQDLEMFSAVYYPHTAIRDENFLKHGLLYWDQIEFVSPFHDYDVMPRYPQTVIRDLAKFTKPRMPTKKEKKQAHDQIMSLLAQGGKRSVEEKAAVAAEQEFVGVDVSKEQLALAVRPRGESWSESNDQPGVRRLVKRLSAIQCAWVVIEVTGGYQNLLASGRVSTGYTIERTTTGAAMIASTRHSTGEPAAPGSPVSDRSAIHYKKPLTSLLRHQALLNRIEIRRDVFSKH